MNHFEKAPSPEPADPISESIPVKSARAENPHGRTSEKTQHANNANLSLEKDRRIIHSRIERDLRKIDADEVQEILDNYGNDYVACCTEIIEYLYSVFEPKNTPKIFFRIRTTSGGKYGHYNPNTNSIVLFYEKNRDRRVTARDIVTAVHEVRHLLQAETYYSQEDSPYSEIISNNYDNYIELKEDYDGYRNQPVEWDAERFGREFLRRFCMGKSSVSNQRNSRLGQIARKILARTS